MILVKLNQTERYDAPFYFALEQYLLSLVDDNKSYFFTWILDPCVVVGRHQLLEAEVNLDFVKSNGINIYRRPSGGGTVYADRNNVMFSFVGIKDDKQSPFQQYLQKLVEVFFLLKVNASYTGRNDLLVDGKKFSGNAFYHQGDKVVMHGTILYDVDVDNLVRSITPNNEKLISKGIVSVRQRVINLKDKLNGMSLTKMIDKVSSLLCEEEITLDEQTIKIIIDQSQKYRDEKWIYHKKPPYRIIKTLAGDFGHMEAHIDVFNNVIKNIELFGDFFVVEQLDYLRNKLINVKMNNEDIKRLLSTIDVSNYIEKLTNEQFYRLLMEPNE
jgi:lipoate---protein ligase